MCELSQTLPDLVEWAVTRTTGIVDVALAASKIA